MTRKTLIGIDIGTTSVKAVLIDQAGARIAAYHSAYPTQRPAPGIVEQNPLEWLACVTAALQGFADHPEVGEVQAIGFASQVNTHVFAGADLAPLCPAIVWQDGRAAAAGARIEALVTADQKLRWLGAEIPIDASHALARIGWMAEHRPDVWQATAHILAPKDFCIARLTGTIAADPLASVGLVGTDLTYADGLIALVAGAAAVLPPLSDPTTVVGRIRAGLPFAGVPVVLGTMDAFASLFGVGVAAAGEAMYLSGTSEVLGLISPHRVPVPGVIILPAWQGITLHAGPTQAGGASLDWLARLLGRGGADLCAMAAPISAATPLFLPHLQGERAPFWDAKARGVFAGLSGATGPADLAASVLEGVAFSARLAFETVLTSGGGRVDVIRLGGGGTVSDRWCQIRADVFGQRLERMAARDAGAVGAAVLAGVGVGVGGLQATAQRLVRLERVFVPDAAAARIAERRFQIWLQLYYQTKPVHAALAEL